MTTPLRDRVTIEPAVDLAAAQAIDCTNVGDSSTLNIKTLGNFRYDATSTDTPDNNNVIEPIVGGGRFIRTTQQSLTVDPSGLIAVDNIAFPAAIVYSQNTLNAATSTGGLTTEVDLYSFDIPANTITLDGQIGNLQMFLTTIPASGTTATKTVRVYFDGIQVFTRSQGGNAALNLSITSELMMSAIQSNCKAVSYRNGQNNRQYTQVTGVDFTNSVNVRITGQSTLATIDLILEYATLQIGGENV